MSDFTDRLLYWGIMAGLLLFIVWLLFSPGPAHDPLVQFTHAVLA
jgi:hypothetical protein